MATIEQLKSEPGLTIVYDGDCPLCRSYITMLRLKSAVAPVKLHDARADAGLVADFSAKGLPLDEGMAAFYGARIYHGSDAVALLSQLSTRSDMFNRMAAAVLESPDRARLLYPLMKAGRAAALLVMRRGPLRVEGPVHNDREA